MPQPTRHLGTHKILDDDSDQSPFNSSDDSFVFQGGLSAANGSDGTFNGGQTGGASSNGLGAAGGGGGGGFADTGSDFFGPYTPMVGSGADQTSHEGGGSTQAYLMPLNGAAHNATPFSGNADIDATLIGTLWTQVIGTGVTLTVSFPTAANQYQTNYGTQGYGDFAANDDGMQPFNSQQQHAAEYALGQLAEFSGLKFSEQVETTTSHATIRFAQTTDSTLGSAHAGFPSIYLQAGDVWLGEQGPQPFYTTPQIGNWGQATIMHELGHAIGLKHGHMDDTSADLSLDLAAPAGRNGSGALPSSHDGQSWSLMTYQSDPANTAATFEGDQYNQPQTYMQDDIAAVQYLYGANYGAGSNNGDSTYTFSTTTGEMFINGIGQGTPTSNIIYRTIWDGGGNDTYNLSNYTTNLFLDLNPGDYSDFGTQLANNRPLDGFVQAPGNIFNALEFNNNPASLIENAFGGSGSDTIYGNDANNVLHGLGGDDTLKGGGGSDTLLGDDGNDTLKGGGGNDFLYGGAGLNTAEFSGNLSTYSLFDGPNGFTVNGGTDGNDTLYNIRTLVFSDTTIVDDQFGDSLTTGTLAAGGTSTGALQFSGDHDWFAVSLVAGHHYVINELGSPSGGGTLSDPYLRLYNSGSTQVTSDDDGGVGFNSQLGIAVNTTGTYYVDAGSFSNFYTGSYTLALLDLGTSTDRFSAPTLVTSNFGANQGWTSENTYPRQLANMNGDDISDIIAFGISGTYVALGNGTGFGASSLVLNNFGTGQGWSSQDSYPRLLADANGDGHLDIVGFGIAGTYVALGTGTSFGSPNFVLANYGANQGWNSQDTYVRELGDVNGDGKADIVAFGVAGTYVSLANTSGGFANPALVLSQFGTSEGWGSQDQYTRVLADVNGDGKADIIGFGQAGTFVSLATGGGNFAATTLEISNFGFNNGWTSNNTYPREVADVNDDGMADVVGFSTSGIYVSLATGNGHFAAPVQTGHDMGTSTGWTSEDAFPRLLADVTGDHRADAVGFGIAGTFISQSHHDWIVV